MTDTTAFRSETAQGTGTAQLTVYYDGSCPLCRAEIAHYRGQDRDSRLDFEDVSAPGWDGAAGLTQQQALARFHVRRFDGQLRSGAAAFVEVWRMLPGWRVIAPVARLPGVLLLLEGLYRLFLPMRPGLARVFRSLAGARATR